MAVAGEGPLACPLATFAVVTRNYRSTSAPAGCCAQEAGAPGWLGECDISVSLLPFPFAPVRQEGARTDRSFIKVGGPETQSGEIKI
jgi:hypothetical protein